MKEDKQKEYITTEEPFDAEAFVESLIKEAADIPCDETEESFHNNEIPPFYDEEKFKSVQQLGLTGVVPGRPNTKSKRYRSSPENHRTSRSPPYAFGSKGPLHFRKDAGFNRLLCYLSLLSFNVTDWSGTDNDYTGTRGQAFFHKYIFSHFFCCMLGLMTVLTVPSVLRILIHTRMSGSSMTAYRRYLSTIFHMMTWYDYDFKPGSRTWQSIADVKTRHNSASKKSCTAGLNRINQKDMAITQFGFLGYAIIRTKLIGIHGATDRELQDFIHVWRVIGYIMGLQDKYNICRDSVEETKQICEVMVRRIFRPSLERRDKDFMEMSRYLAEGMWTVNPFLSHKVLLCYVYSLMTLNDRENQNGGSNLFVELDYWEKILLNIFHSTMYYLQYNLFRLHQNTMQYFALWIMKVFPFLAYYLYGYRNSHVKILNGVKSD